MSFELFPFPTLALLDKRLMLMTLLKVAALKYWGLPSTGDCWCSMTFLLFNDDLRGKSTPLS
jgi:hypothetical protein